jgi:hypothetical protein
MLHESQIKNAVLAAQEIDRRGLIARAQPGTPLAKLVDAMTNCSVTSEVPQKEYDPNILVIKAASTSYGADMRGESVAHNELIDGFKRDIGRHILRHIAYTRTVAKPLITEVIEKFSQAVSGYKLDPFANMRVIEYKIPEVAYDPGLRDELNKFKTMAINRAVQDIELPDLTVDQIIDTLATGTGVDEELRLWAASKGEAFLIKLWASMFGRKPGYAPPEELRLGDDGFDYSFGGFLLASHLIGNPGDGVEMSLAEYNTRLNSIRNSCALRCAWLLDDYDAAVKSKLMIKNYSSEQIVVVSEVYQEWLKAGGNPSLLLACVLMPEPIRYAQLIEKNIKDLESRWSSHLALLRAGMDNRKYTIYRELMSDILTRCVGEDFKEIYSNVKTDNYLTSNEYQTFKNKLDEALRYVKTSAYDDVPQLVHDLVCNCVFYHADSVKMLLEGINEAKRMNPNLSLDEAALISTARYVTAFVMDQVSLVPALGRK